MGLVCKEVSAQNKSWQLRAIALHGLAPTPCLCIGLVLSHDTPDALMVDGFALAGLFQRFSHPERSIGPVIAFLQLSYVCGKPLIPGFLRILALQPVVTGARCDVSFFERSPGWDSETLTFCYCL